MYTAGYKSFQKMQQKKFYFLLLPALFWVFVVACHKPWYILQHQDSHYTVYSADPQDSNILALIKPYKTGIDTQMRQVIGHAAIPMTKAQPECGLGNFMADAQLEIIQRIDTSIRISVVNYGGIRLPYLPSGSITKGKIFELMPFDNQLVILEVSGSLLRTFCNHMAKLGGWPVSGISYSIRNDTAENILVEGKALVDTTRYKIVLSDYIAGGGDYCFFLKEVPAIKTGVLLRDALLEYLRTKTAQGISIEPKISGRVTYAE